MEEEDEATYIEMLKQIRSESGLCDLLDLRIVPEVVDIKFILT